tara:strand:+ start:3758 stop:4162 length:405 start_codon:yes stop_codon:yes gene_type:complete
MGKKITELKHKSKGYHDHQQNPKDPDVMMTPKEAQLLMRERGYANSKQRVNSDMVFNHPDMKKNTKGYDKLTGEIEKRGRPADNQDKIFVKKPEPDKSQEQIKKEKDKNDAKRREALNKKLYRDRLKTKWDRGW